MERAITATLPLAFLLHLRISEAVLARRHLDLGGHPPIRRWLFLAGKYLAIGIWMAMALQSWGIGFPLLAGGVPLRWSAIGLWLFGFTLLSLGRINLGAHVRIGLPGEATALHRGGVYRFSRNPMYAGLDATVLAAILYTRNPAILVLAALVIAIHHRIILAEERWLRTAFGEEYGQYRSRVGRYITFRFAASGWADRAASRTVSRAACRMRSLRTLLKMGHCAPTVMRTLLDLSGRGQDWLVRLVAGLPGGIGNGGGECGGFTSALLLLGLREGLGPEGRDLPALFDRGWEHLQRFRRQNSTLLCREIRTSPRRLGPCIRTILCSPELYARELSAPCPPVVAGEARAAWRRLYGAFSGCGFHCAQEVLRKLDGQALPELLAASGAFLGGTLFQGLTCSALTAGIMALGSRIGEIENSRWRVLRMVALLRTGGAAFDNRINKFNRAMNLGGELAEWFAGEFTTTQCRGIAQADFSSLAGVQAYLQGGGIQRCQGIAGKVAARVRSILEQQTGFTSGRPGAWPVVPRPPGRAAVELHDTTPCGAAARSI